MLCVGLVKSQMKPDDEFICKNCKSKKTTTPGTGNSTSANNPSKKLKPQTLNSSSSSSSSTAAANGTNGPKKRFTRSKDDAGRDKTATPIIKNANENSVDNSKENEPRPNNSTKSDSQSICTSRPKVSEKSN